MNNPQTLHLVDKCFRAKAKLTETVYYNICDGTQAVVPHGLGEYMLGISLFILFVAVISMIIMLGLSIREN